MNFRPIGIVKSAVKEQIDQGWGRVVSHIVLEKEYAAGLQGLKKFSHILVIFYMHEAKFNPHTDLVRRPQGRKDMPKLGIFAQRAKHRPNPIGITAVELIGIRKNVLRVKGLDAIEGTPVLDIKPYFPQFDRISHPLVPPWVKRLMKNYF
ncbi:MAG: tRNA (N6-threonylcarbamoyladenosine(37)-N6)-methyltransferase TrmO [bacterium]